MLNGTPRKKYSRTPSGSNLQNKVGQTRTIFSKDRNSSSKVHKDQRGDSQTCELFQVQSQQQSRIVGQRPKQLYHVQLEQSVKGLSDTETEGENYITPPSTPKITKAVFENPLSKSIFLHKMAQQTSSEISDIERKSQESGTEVADKNTVIQELEEMMDAHDEEKNGPQVIDIKLVHGMFKRMEESFKKELQAIKQQIQMKEVTERDEEMPLRNTDIMEDLTQQVKRLALKTKAVASAVQNAWEDRNQLQERVSKIEKSAHKKMVIISGLETFGKKNEKIKQLENFLYIELKIKVDIEDFFELGTPGTTVIILPTQQQKIKIMQNKKLLKGRKNDRGKFYYINDYQPVSYTQAQRKLNEIYWLNEERDADQKEDMKLTKGSLFIDGHPYV